MYHKYHTDRHTHKVPFTKWYPTSQEKKKSRNSVTGVRVWWGGAWASSQKETAYLSMKASASLSMSEASLSSLTGC